MSLKLIPISNSLFDKIKSNKIQLKLKKQGYCFLSHSNKELLVFVEWNTKFKDLINNSKKLLVIDYSQHSDTIFGGSICKTELIFENNNWCISKVAASKSTLEANDGYVRHLNEGEWMSSFEIQNLGLFPISSYLKKPNEIKLLTKFIPANTLGEQLWAMDNSVDSVITFFGKLFARLNNSLYLLKPKIEIQSENYIDKITRRWKNLMKESDDSMWERIYFHPFVINEIEYCSLETILFNLKNNSDYLPLNNDIFRRVYCHGDLIPEDILVDSNLRDFILIDPNPQNQDPICDWSKLYMSLSVYYELAIKDLVNVKIYSKSNLTKLNLSYEIQAKDYINYIDKILIKLDMPESLFMKELSNFNSKITLKNIRINAGLMAIAIIPFHILKHNKNNRSIHFLAKGLELLKITEK